MLQKTQRDKIKTLLNRNCSKQDYDLTEFVCCMIWMDDAEL